MNDTPRIPPSFEYDETFGSEAETPSTSRLSRKRNRIIGAVLLTAAVITGAVVFSQRGGGESNPLDDRKSAEDYAYPDEAYVPRCEVVTSEAERLLNSTATEFIKLYYSDAATNKELANFNGPGSYGNIFFDIPREDGSYQFSLIAAKGDDGKILGETAYIADVYVKSSEGETLSISVGSPNAFEDTGGPNFPVESVNISYMRKNGLASELTWYDWPEGPTDEQCQTTLHRADELLTDVLEQIKTDQPIQMPDNLLP